MGTFKSWFLDILFPRQCLECRILLSGKDKSYICPACLAGIKVKNDFACAFCGSPVIAGLTCPFCKPGHFLDRLWVATSYENPLVGKILKTMKYRFVRSLADDIAKLMAKYLEGRFSSALNIDRGSIIVVPVPLHRLRLNWRGFNQAEIIGSRIGFCLGLNLRQDALGRNRHHTPQARIADRESRIANTKGVFECQKPESVRGKTALLIDDVATTGSTLDDCARALKGAGAKEVIGFVFARGTPASDKKLLQ
jgi:ComF family protein